MCSPLKPSTRFLRLLLDLPDSRAAAPAQKPEGGAGKTTCFCFPDTSANQTPLQQNLNKLGNPRPICGQNRFGIPFCWVGEFTTHFRTGILVGGLVDVHWGYDLDFDPWPYVFRPWRGVGRPFWDRRRLRACCNGSTSKRAKGKFGRGSVKICCRNFPQRPG